MLRSLEREPNVTLLEPEDERDAVPAETCVLLTRSLPPKTFCQQASCREGVAALAHLTTRAEHFEAFSRG